MNEAQRQAWNAAVASGEPERIARLQADLLRENAQQIMDDDPNYAIAGYTPTATAARGRRP